MDAPLPNWRQSQRDGLLAFAIREYRFRALFQPEIRFADLVGGFADRPTVPAFPSDFEGRIRPRDMLVAKYQHVVTADHEKVTQFLARLLEHVGPRPEIKKRIISQFG